MLHFIKTALLHIKNEIQLALLKDMPSVLVLLDLSGAFDTIDHATLLDRLKLTFDVSGVILPEWPISNCKSWKWNITHPRLLKYGVPQGLVLNHILFFEKNLRYHFNADDRQIYFHIVTENAKEVLIHCWGVLVTFNCGWKQPNPSYTRQRQSL